MTNLLPSVASLIALASVSACSSESAGADTISSSLEEGLAWVGDTHLRYDGKWIPSRVVMSDRPLDVYTQTFPRGQVHHVELFWKDAAAAVHSAPMIVDLDRAGPSGANTQWRATIPAPQMQSGASLEYWIRAEGRDGRVLWDSKGGQNHRITPKDEVVLWDAGAPDLWRNAGRGGFAVEDGALVAKPGDGLGLFWCTVPTPPGFELTLEFRLDDANDNSGIFVRFRDPETFGYDNTAWAAVDDGLEIQIDETARPDGADVHRTGAFYEVPNQLLSLAPARPAGEWNQYTIRARGHELTVDLNGQRVSTLAYAGDGVRPLRGLPSAPGAPRFIGIQSHTGAVAFRNIRLRRVADTTP